MERLIHTGEPNLATSRTAETSLARAVWLHRVRARRGL